MMWSVPALLLLLILGVSCSRVQHGQYSLQGGLNQDRLPCENFFEHTCNFGNDEVKDFMFYHGSYLVSEIAMSLSPDEDFVYRRLISAMTKVAASTGNQNQCLHGKAGLPTNHNERAKLAGEWIADGRSVPFKIYCKSKYRCFLEYVNPAQQLVPGQAPRAPVTTLYSQFAETDTVKLIFEGYFRALDFTFDHDIFIVHPVISYREVDSTLASISNWDTNKHYLTRFLEHSKQAKTTADNHNLFLSYTKLNGFNQYSAYFNVLYSYTMYKHPKTFHPEIADDFQKLSEKIVDEICETIENSDWLRVKSRKMLSSRIRRLQIHSGIPKPLRGLEQLKELLDLYHTAIGKVSEDQDVCELEMITRAIAKTQNRLLLKRAEKGTIDFLRYGTPNADANLFSLSLSVRQGDKIFVRPPLLHFLHGNYSLGFKYGYAGSEIAHQIFHHLGLTNKEKDYLNRVVQTDHFKDAQECYYDFYGSFCLDQGNECPWPLKKAEEGFCDVEGSRVLLRILKKAVGQPNYNSRAKRDTDMEQFPLFGSYASFWSSNGRERLLADSDSSDSVLLEETKWFFYGKQFERCRDSFVSENMQAKQMRTDNHPRDFIRVHANIKQLNEFSEAFKCKEGERNYVLPEEEICAAYPVIGKNSKVPAQTKKPVANTKVTQTQPKMMQTPPLRPTPTQPTTGEIGNSEAERTETESTISTASLSNPVVAPEAAPLNVSGATFEIQVYLMIVIVLIFRM